MAILEDLITINNEDIKRRLVSFNNIMNGVEGIIATLLSDFGLVLPITLEQIQTLTVVQKAAFKKRLLPCVVEAIKIDIFFENLTTIDDPQNPGTPKYSSVSDVRNDLGTYFTGATLTTFQNNLDKINTVRAVLSPLINDDLILAQTTALTDFAVSVQANAGSIQEL